jgi:hypothetical protein
VPEPAELVATGPAVRLGFSDGTSVVLDGGSVQATALRDIASTLVSEHDPRDLR